MRVIKLPMLVSAFVKKAFQGPSWLVFVAVNWFFHGPPDDETMVAFRWTCC